MSRHQTELTDALVGYIQTVSSPEPEYLIRLREETARDPLAMMQISPDQGRFLAWLVRLLHARRTLEVGVFTGYSSLCVAAALPPDGQLIACDVSERWTSIARRYWREAGLDQRIALRLAPAIETLDALLAGGQESSFDFAFIDADKTNYLGYYERALRLVRPGGVIAVDNVLWHGQVADPAATDDDTVAIREFNRVLAADARVHSCLLPLGDGLTLAIRR